MSSFVVSLRPEKVWLRREFLFDDQFAHGEFEKALLISAKSITGRAMEFEVLTDSGVLRDKLPLEAICTCREAPRVSTQDLQLWNCFSKNMVVIKKPILNRVKVFKKSNGYCWGKYWWTFDFCLDDNIFDLNLAEQPDEHKCMHFINTDDGNFMLQPNNRCIWADPSFVTRPFNPSVRYKVTSKFVDCETETWRTSDDDLQFYGVLPNDL
jgi:hypothetical protein